MTKKDYIKLAGVMLRNKPITHDFSPDRITWGNTVLDMAQVLQQDNPRFNKDRFLTACGVE